MKPHPFLKGTTKNLSVELSKSQTQKFIFKSTSSNFQITTYNLQILNCQIFK